MTKLTSQRLNRSSFASTIRSIPAAMILAASITATGVAQENKPADKGAGEAAASSPTSLPIQRLIAFKRAGLGDFLVDDKDKNLKAAIAMLQSRINELPQESEGQFPQEALNGVEQVFNVISRPSRFAVTFNPQSNVGGLMGYGVVASSMFETQEQAGSFGEFVDDSVRANQGALPKLSKIYTGMRTMTVPGGKLSFGPRAGNKTYDVFFGSVPDDVDAACEAIPPHTIEGLKPVVTGSFDGEALTPLTNLVGMFAGQASSAALTDYFDNIHKIGLVGPGAVKGTFEMGYTADAMRSRIVVNNAAKALEASDMTTARLTAAELNIVPADVHTAVISLISSKNWQSTFDQIRNATETPEGENPFAEGVNWINQKAGINIEKDLPAALGGFGGVYSSASSGGGFLGLVAFFSFKDRDAFITLHDKLVKLAGDQVRAADPRAARYIKLREWKHENVSYYTLTPVGLPVPLEFTYVMSDRVLLAGLTPQSVMSAVKQASGKGDKGILSRKDLAPLDVAKQELLSLTFYDTLTQARKGYNVTTMLGSAVSNAVRSPMGDASREPGIIVPSINELLANVKPSVQFSHRSNGSIIMEHSSDRSALVMVSSVIGTASDVAPLIALITSAGFFKSVQDNNGFEPGFTFNSQMLSPMNLTSILKAGRNSDAYVMLNGFGTLFGGPIPMPMPQAYTAGVASELLRVR